MGKIPNNSRVAAKLVSRAVDLTFISISITVMVACVIPGWGYFHSIILSDMDTIPSNSRMAAKLVSRTIDLNFLTLSLIDDGGVRLF